MIQLVNIDKRCSTSSLGTASRNRTTGCWCQPRKIAWTITGRCVHRLSTQHDAANRQCGIFEVRQNPPHRVHRAGGGRAPFQSEEVAARDQPDADRQARRGSCAATPMNEIARTETEFEYRIVAAVFDHACQSSYREDKYFAFARHQVLQVTDAVIRVEPECHAARSWNGL